MPMPFKGFRKIAPLAGAIIMTATSIGESIAASPPTVFLDMRSQSSAQARSELTRQLDQGVVAAFAFDRADGLAVLQRYYTSRRIFHLAAVIAMPRGGGPEYLWFYGGQDTLSCRVNSADTTDLLRTFQAGADYFHQSRKAELSSLIVSKSVQIVGVDREYLAKFGRFYRDPKTNKVTDMQVTLQRDQAQLAQDRQALQSALTLKKEALALCRS